LTHSGVPQRWRNCSLKMPSGKDWQRTHNWSAIQSISTLDSAYPTWDTLLLQPNKRLLRKDNKSTLTVLLKQRREYDLLLPFSDLEMAAIKDFKIHFFINKYSFSVFFPLLVRIQNMFDWFLKYCWRISQFMLTFLWCVISLDKGMSYRIIKQKLRYEIPDLCWTVY
jgi:hypothetical protein